MKLALVSSAAVLTLAGCATPAPFSYIDGNRYFRSEMNTYPVIVLDVDGKSTLQNPTMVEPGTRVIRVQGPPGTRLGRGEDRAFTLDVKPCTHYYLKAVKKSSIDDDFVPAVDYALPITNCGGSVTK